MLLYLIIPPIVVIISLVGIIIILSKKMSRVQEINKEEDSFKKADDSSDGSKRWSKIIHFHLGILEKVIQRLKIISLKMHNISGDLTNLIREKRKKHILEKMEKEERIKKEQEEQKIEISYTDPSDEEKTPKPMLSEQITHPEQLRKEEKDEMEEDLIQRVASDPRDVEAYERLGDYYIEQEKYTDAKECYKYVLKLSPSNRAMRYKMRKLEKLLTKV